MKERPILFSGEMVRALLDGRKTQTRRLVTPQPFSNGRWVKELGDIVCYNDYLPPDAFMWQRRPGVVLSNYEDDWTNECCPYGQPGDRLWVRETWGLQVPGDLTDWHRGTVRAMSRPLEHWRLEYAADWGPNQDASYWRPSIHMPRWASRITLEVTSVRVERLQDISGEDVKAEGVVFDEMFSKQDHFARLWDSLNGKRAPWESNPWVWVVSFARVKPSRAPAATAPES
ncbi:MAG TPA: hypothetical protein VFQ76_08460 [Longimicrobiaceae bacterium]|nr:hypothetical protein [Longimicrobiaceae bacterium]